MKDGLAIRGMLLLLALLLLGIGAIAWSLLYSGRPETQSTIVARNGPAVEAERRAPITPPEKSASAAITEATKTIKGLGDQIVPPVRESVEAVPSFDIARIEPNGEAVIAGRATPGVTVELLRGGEVHDRTVADPSGAFVFVPQPLPPGNYDLALRVTEPSGKVVQSKATVAVMLNAAKQEKPVVALMTPEKPAVVLSKPTEKIVADIRIDVVETEGGGKLHVSGTSAPGASVRLYLNDAYIAAGTASPDGRVEFSIRGGVKEGEYRIRLERVDPSGNVLARAEVPFSAPASRETARVSPSPSGPAPASEVASAQRSADDTLQQTPTGSTSRGDAVVVSNIDTKVVIRGDNLWRISQASYGNGGRYTVIYGANRNQIRNPNLIYPGQIFVLPKAQP